jgi:hypothetical protein
LIGVEFHQGEHILVDDVVFSSRLIARRFVVYGEVSVGPLLVCEEDELMC